MWVRSEYASELAVLSAWLAALIPWNVTYATFGQFGSMLFVRFPLFQVQYSWLEIGAGGQFNQSGIEVIDNVWLADPLSAYQFYERGATGTANAVWAVGAAVVALAVVLSIALYVDEERVESGPVDPVRVMGALLAVGTVAFAVSTWLFWRDGPGIPVPIGVVVLFVLSATLLTVKRTDGVEDGDDERTGVPDENVE